MQKLSRRELLYRSLAGAGAVMTAPMVLAGAQVTGDAAKPQTATSLVPLGQSGIRCSFLAMGTGVSGGQRTSEHTRMGEEKCCELIRYGIEKGINFLDMADLYGTHPFVRKAIAGMPREKFVMLTKLWTYPDKVIKPSGGALTEVDQYRKELNTDMIDIVLIHCMMDKEWIEKQKRVRDELSELKAKKVIRAVGVSCHSFDAMKAAVEHPWTDVLLARINNKGEKMDASPEEVSEVLLKARANGKVVVGMKIFGEGTLVQPEQKDASLKYVLGKGLVNAMTIGMLKKEEIDDSIARINATLKALG
jgi:predicted aldo/keto reductase-like oxidoreductase